MRLGFLTDYSFLIRTLLIYFSTLILRGFSIYGYVTISRGMHSFILFGCEDYMLQFSFRWIQLQYLSINVLMDVNLFRMAPPTRTTLNPDPPPPPPPPEAWQAVMAATNANTQLAIQPGVACLVVLDVCQGKERRRRTGRLQLPSPIKLEGT